jgi:hypothetical protein
LLSEPVLLVFGLFCLSNRVDLLELVRTTLLEMPFSIAVVAATFEGWTRSIVGVRVVVPALEAKPLVL